MDRQRRDARRPRLEEPPARRGPHRPPPTPPGRHLARQRPDVRHRTRRAVTERGTILGYTTIHRAWKDARTLALPPELAATPLGKRPYDLRHSALSTWLAAGADPAEVAQRAGNSVEVLLTRYAKCLYDRQSLTNQRIESLLSAYDLTSEFQ
ncbi:hypothetical protein V2S66_19220 [Streptomyces sp. V4-01]|uniref:Tyr recombinase domain-containing protein n=1 Tax=Actinacidiphila polyblastidii TaxID=3110430 RepID=A0ABU7PE76_9ACTN|nr:hypothetical protein [Streptomyces sp. V4-01]